MKKSEADKIAQKIANDWKLFWMSQTQNKITIIIFVDH